MSVISIHLLTIVRIKLHFDTLNFRTITFMFVKKIPGYKADCIAVKWARDIIAIRASITSSLRQFKFIIFDAHGKRKRQIEAETETEREGGGERERQSQICRKKWVMAHYLHESQRCNIRANPMPEGRRRRCPNVINIFRARRVEKDSLPPPFLHPPRLVLFSPGPNFLADAPSAEGPPQIFNLHFSFPFPPTLPAVSSPYTDHHYHPLPLLLSVKAHSWILSGHIEKKV